MEGIHPQSVPFSKLLYCQQFSGAAHPTFSSFKATVDSTMIDFTLDHLKEKMPVSFRVFQWVSWCGTAMSKAHYNIDKTCAQVACSLLSKDERKNWYEWKKFCSCMNHIEYHQKRNWFHIFKKKSRSTQFTITWHLAVSEHSWRM